MSPPLPAPLRRQLVASIARGDRPATAAVAVTS